MRTYPKSLRGRPLYGPHISPTANSARFCFGPIIKHELCGRRGMLPWILIKDLVSFLPGLAFTLVDHHLRVRRALVHVCISGMHTSFYQLPTGSINPMVYVPSPYIGLRKAGPSYHPITPVVRPLAGLHASNSINYHHRLCKMEESR